MHLQKLGYPHSSPQFLASHVHSKMIVPHLKGFVQGVFGNWDGQNEVVELDIGENIL